MKYFVIFLILIGFAGFSSVSHAELDSSILEPFEDNDLVVIGKVIQANVIPLENKTQYNIKVEEYLKGQTSFDMVTAILDDIIPGDFPSDPLDYYNKPYFEKENTVLVYLKQEGGTYKMSPYSFTIKKPSVAGPPTVIHPTGPSGHFLSQGDEIVISGTIKKGYLYGLEKANLDSSFNLVVLNQEGEKVESKKLTISPDGIYGFTFQNKGELRIPGQYSWEITYENGGMGGEFVIVVDSKLWTPLKQVKSGITTDEIQCRNSLVLVTKHDGTPACVNPDTKTKLIQRGWAIEPIFFGLTKLQITDIQLAKFGCKKLGNQTYCDEMVQEKIEYYLKQNKLNTKLEPESSPEPAPMSDAETQLYDARKSLQTAYQNHVNLGPYYIKDVIVGFGTYDDTLIIDIPSKYTDQDSIQIIKKEIRHIVGDQVKIDYIIYDEPIERHIETVIPYMWNKTLHQKNIDFTPKEMSYFNNADGFKQHDRVCSPLVAPNGTEFYISSTFDLEPFEITGTFIDKTDPGDCHKIWRTEVIMQEPDRVTALWLENEN